MKTLLILFTTLFFITVNAQESVRLAFDTGDGEMNAHLTKINAEAKENLNTFRTQLTTQFGAKEEVLDRYLIKERKEPADLYFGFELSVITGKPLPDIMKLHSVKKGWGSIAKDLGIKPGSDEFHLLKKNTMKDVGNNKNKNVNKNQKNSNPDKMKDDHPKNHPSNDNKKK